MRPVVRGVMKYESLIDGSVDISDVARCNDALSVYDENSYRMGRAMRPEG